MSPAMVAIFTNPPRMLNCHHLFNGVLPKNPYSIPNIRTYKESTIVYKKSVRLKKIMVARSTENRIVGDCDDKRISPTISALELQEGLINNGASFHQPAAGGIHVILNRLSKSVVAISFGGLIMLRHDGLAFWAAMGSVSNFILSITLKHIVKQERPVTEVSSGHGMPSSHAQSIFFALVFMILSVVEWMGSNRVTAILGVLLVALASYLSWLRVLLHYHTTNQVVVGAIVGSIFSVSWFWAWEAIVHEAYISNLLVRNLLCVGVACYYLGFISDFLWHLIRDR